MSAHTPRRRRGIGCRPHDSTTSAVAPRGIRRVRLGVPGPPRARAGRRRTARSFGFGSRRSGSAAPHAGSSERRNSTCSSRRGAAAGRSAARCSASRSAFAGDSPSLSTAVAAQVARSIGCPRSFRASGPLAARRATWLPSINSTCSRVVEPANHQRAKSPAATSRHRGSQASTVPTRWGPGTARCSHVSCVVFPTLSTPLSDTDNGCSSSAVTTRSSRTSGLATAEAVGDRR